MLWNVEAFGSYKIDYVQQGIAPIGVRIFGALTFADIAFPWVGRSHASLGRLNAKACVI